MARRSAILGFSGRVWSSQTEQEDYECAWDMRRLPKPGIDAVMLATQREGIMDKQPNSHICVSSAASTTPSGSMGLHRARWGAIGLHLRFYTDEEGRCVARFRPKPEHQGHPGQLHGGLVSTLLDTVMVR